MGAKLSKKKKGYCLGAGKDGESTDTTEVEQKEVETQAGQKDAAEPHREKTPIDQTLNNGASEEQKAQVEKPNSTEVPSGETTKDHINKDQKSENKPSAEQKKVEESKQEQDQHAKSSNTSQQTAAEGEKVKSQPEEKPQIEHDKEKESVATDKPTQELKPVTDQGSSELEQQNQSVTEPSAPLPEQKDVPKAVPDPETKMKVEKMEKEQTSALITEPPSEQATKEPTPGPVSVKEPEKAPEIAQVLVSEATLVKPEPMNAPVAEHLEAELANKLVEPEPANNVVPGTPEVVLQETVQVVELVKTEPDLVPVTDSVPVAEPVKSKASEEPVALVPEVKIVKPVVDPEPVSCPEPEPLSETKEETESLPEPLPSNEVPDSTAEENVKNSGTLGNVDLVTETVETQAATTESAEKNPHLEAENCPSEGAVEEKQESKAHDTISKEQEVEDKEVQNDVKEESVSDKQPTEHGSLEKGKDCEDTEEVVLDTSKNESDQVFSEDTTVHHSSQDKSAEDKIENHEMPAEEFPNEPSALLIVDKHGVRNGLPAKEEVKVHLENGCDLHELNGQSECREIEVCVE